MAIFVANEQLTELMLLLESENPDDIPDTDEVAKTLKELSGAIAYGGPGVREAMLEREAYELICKAWALCCWSGVSDVPSPAHSAIACRNAVLIALYTLTAGFPEIIDEIGWQIITQAVDKTVPRETQILVIKLIRNVSLKSEENREYFTWGLGLLEPLVCLAMQDDPTSEFICEWCASIKALLLSDDPRVPYNRATERKRVVADTGILPILAGFLNKTEFDNDEGALNAMVILLGSMAVNEDMCMHIENGNALPGLNHIIKNHFHNKTLLRNSVSLLRYIACNDVLREKLSGYPFMRWVVEVINYYKKDADIVDVAVSCIGFMTLKNACQSAQFIARNGLPLLLQTMMDFNKDITILKGALFVLRNVCENSDNEGREKVITLGYVTVFSQLISEVPELKDYYIAPLLRELGITDLSGGGGEEEDEEEEEEDGEDKFDDKSFLLEGEDYGEDDAFGILSGF